MTGPERDDANVAGAARARSYCLSRGNPRLLRGSLAALGLLPELFSASLWRPSSVHDDQGVGKVLSRAHLDDPRAELSQPARLRDHAPDASRVQRHAPRPALTRPAEELLCHDVANEGKIRGSQGAAGGARAALR